MLEELVYARDVEGIKRHLEGQSHTTPPELTQCYGFDLSVRWEKGAKEVPQMDHLSHGNVLHLGVLTRDEDVVTALVEGCGGSVGGGGEGVVGLYIGEEVMGETNGFYFVEWSPTMLAHELGLVHVEKVLGGGGKKKRRRKRKGGGGGGSGNGGREGRGKGRRRRKGAAGGGRRGGGGKKGGRRRKKVREGGKKGKGKGKGKMDADADDDRDDDDHDDDDGEEEEDEDHEGSTSSSFSRDVVTYKPSRRRTVAALADAGKVDAREVGGGEEEEEEGPEWTQIPREELVVGDKFDSGGFGSVHYGQYAGLEVAVKVVDIPAGSSSGEGAEEFYKELHALSVANVSGHVCKLYGFCIVGPARLALVMQLYDGCLHDVIECCPGKRMRTVDVIPAALDIACGLRDLHELGIVMRDLKPANCLVDSARDLLVLADFGLARLVADPASRQLATTRNEACTPNYAAPECFKDGKLTPACDIWSWAATTVHMFTGSPPFMGNSIFAIATKTAVNRETPEIPERAPQLLKELLVRCFAYDAEDRPSAADLVEELEGVIARGGY